MQYIQMVNPTSGCSVLPTTTTPGGTITCNLGTVTGSTSMTFRYYIPLNDISGSAVINAGIGNDVLSQNTAYATGSWQPLDGRDLLTLVTVDAAGYEHILTDKSIAIQKGVDNITGAPNNPGDVLRYTLNFQVSDYFAFDEINITDVLSDGQHLLLGDSYDPQLSINGNQYTLQPLHSMTIMWMWIAITPADREANVTGITRQPTMAERPLCSTSLKRSPVAAEEIPMGGW